MYQNNRGEFRKQESLFGEFRHSCLGRLIIIGGILGILAVIAWLTNPSEQTMREEMNDNIRQWIQENDSLNTDGIDDAVQNTGFIFTSADSVDTPEQKQMLESFEKHNRLVYFDHTLFSTMHIYNSFHVEGKRCGIGVFGLVIPTVNFNDFLLREGPMRKDYNQPVIRNYGNDEYFGENPDLGGVFRYDGE
ncbi:MAG: hypothetical protein IJ544_04920 [Prevotella sp.]|nr:hypothetical protein [Prevotella sp.]